MEIIGHTRRGSPIYLNWPNASSDKNYQWFQNFESFDEHFDAWTVFAVYGVHISRADTDFQKIEFIENLIERHFCATGGETIVTLIEKSLGIHDAFDRQKHGLKLLNFEFQLK